MRQTGSLKERGLIVMGKVEKKRSGTVRKSFLLFSLILLLGFGAVACGEETAETDSLPNAPVNETLAADLTEVRDGGSAVQRLGVNLLRQTYQEEGENNLVVSPLSVMYAVGMSANGAAAETLTEMETVLGLSLDQLNAFLKEYTAGLQTSERFKMNLANSLWLNTDGTGSFVVNPEFVQTVREAESAQVFEREFADGAVLDEINQWVQEETNGLIQNMLSEIPVDAVMYLINALALDASWTEPYTENQIERDIFTTAMGEEQQADFLTSTESIYLEDEYAVGFMKPYAGGSRYAFVGLLPKEGQTLAEYLETLTEGGLASVLATATEEYSVDAALPKFKNEYEVELSALLGALGMESAFGEEADFSQMGTTAEENLLYISAVLHKAKISVDENGTEAAAATAVEMENASAVPLEQETKEVRLNRPFVYLLLDRDENVPLFMGTVDSLG